MFSELTVQEHLRLAWRAEADTATQFPALESLRAAGPACSAAASGRCSPCRWPTGHKPALMLADEMSLGLAPVVIRTLMPQLRELVGSTKAGMVLVEQGIATALRRPRTRKSERAERSERERVMSALARFDLGGAVRVLLRALGYGQRKLVDLLRARLGEPRLLLLGEPGGVLRRPDVVRAYIGG